ncbi:MAG: Cell division protein FtsL [Firmicutes bacterium]|nr:Cell division protein FtsL [Bacillota bacterium]
MSNIRPLPNIVYFPTAFPARKKKKRRALVLGAVFLAVVYLAITFVAQELAMVRLREREIELLAVRSSLTEQATQLQAEIERLQTPEHIERLARQRLGLLKPQDGILLPVIVTPRR